MKFNIHFTPPPLRVIFTLFLAISLLTGCMTEADSGSNGDNGQVTIPGTQSARRTLRSMPCGENQ